VPTFIKADPNPVIVTIWSVSQRGPTTISWDTGSAISGTIWVTDDAKAEKLLDNKNKLAVGPRGTAATFVFLGKKRIFELRRTDNDKIVLATVVVEGREELGLPGGMRIDLGQRFPLMQGITNLRVLPDIDWVRILFRTRQPTNPIIDIRDAKTQELATGAILGRLSQTHDYTFQLAQDTLFRFHIVAYSTGIGSRGGKPSEEEGLFNTGSRSAHVFFDQVVMHTDGDPGSLGDGEFLFDMGAGDIYSGDMLGETPTFNVDMSGGEFRALDQSVVITPAPAELWVQVIASENDRDLLGPFGEAMHARFAPEGSTWRTTGDWEYSTVTKWFDLSDAGPVPQEIPFKLETGPKHVDFTLNCRLRMETKPGVVHLQQPNVTKSAKPVGRARTIAMMVSGESVAVAGRETHVVQLARDGNLYRAIPPDTARAKAMRQDRNVHWTSVASDLCEPLIVVAAGDVLHLFAPGKAGEALHRVVSPDAEKVMNGYGRWTSLGGSFVWPLAVAVIGENIDLFGLSAEGGVFHKALNSKAKGEWKKIGEGMVGSLNTFTTERGEIGVVAVGSNGKIQHLPWSSESVSARSPKWRSLGTAPKGALSSEVFDGVVVFAVLGEDETVSAAPWRNYPERPDKLEWQALGTMNSLISARYSLLPTTRAAAEANKPAAALRKVKNQTYSTTTVSVRRDKRKK
jgi:hypothetical protein